ncbi:MAG: hypothetical protein FJW39_04160 [Acidobacteria bacterium]|nr:hypothetical protein [Acidobacteriota bacterium]
MRLLFLIPLATALSWAAETGSEFTGEWALSNGQAGAPPSLKIHLEKGVVRCSGCGPGEWRFTLDGKPANHSAGGVRTSIVTKWEGSALLLNVIVSGTQNQVISDRWKVSRDGSRMTVLRQVQKGGGESESTLVYERPGAVAKVEVPVSGPVVVAPPAAAPTRQEKAAPKEFVIDAGRRLPLKMLSDVTTRNAQAGDRVYLETAFPIVVDQHVVIPPGSQVTASVRMSQQAGKVRGRAALMFAFETITLPNGVSRPLRARLAGAEPGQGSVGKEGEISGRPDKGGDAGKTAESTATGAGVGAAVGAASGRYGTGAAVGAAAGAAVGLARVLGGRGPEIIMRRGDSAELILEDAIRLTDQETRPKKD